MSLTNYQYLKDNWTLPPWFDYCDIDWHRYYATKHGKFYTKEKSKDDINYIYDEKKVNAHDIFVNYLAFLNGREPINDLSQEEMQIILNIKICDYDWHFLWSDPIFDKNSNETLLTSTVHSAC